MAELGDFWSTEQGKMLRHHDIDLYRGKGKENPSVTMRLSDVENRTRDIKETINAHDKKLDRLFWLVAIGVGILITLQFLAPLIKDTVKSSVSISRDTTVARSYPQHSNLY